MHFALVVALTADGGIGRENKLPWYPASLSADMCWFKRLTQSSFHIDGNGIRFAPSTGNIVLMGRRTWDSIPSRFRPLPGRLNVILSRSKRKSDIEGAAFISHLEDLSYMHDSTPLNNPVFVIGGRDIYSLAMESGHVKFIFATHVISPEPLDCDTFFPNADWESYIKEDITREVSRLVDPKIRNSCYAEDLNVFFESNMRFKMLLYTRYDK